MLGLLILPLLSAGLRAAAPSAGLRVATAGHSFHYRMPGFLTEVAGLAGIPGHRQFVLSGLGGSRVIDHWNAPDGTDELKAALAAGTAPHGKPTPPAREANRIKPVLAAGSVDVLTLSPIYLPDEGIEHFVRLGLEHKPDLRILVQEFWLPFDDRHLWENRGAGVEIDRDRKTIAELRAAHEPYFREMDAHVGALNRKFGRQAVFVVPVGQAVLALRERIIRGDAPGLARQTDLFTDKLGHSHDHITVLAAYCHFAVIYRRSPVGLPASAAIARLPEGEKLSRLLQEIAWEAVTQHPLSGVVEGNTATIPATRGEVWERRHRTITDEVRRLNPEVVLLGDSITHHWRVRGQPAWQKFLGGIQPGNLGIGGDRTQHLLWRIRDGALAGLSPKVAVVLIGTNNLGFEPETTVLRNRSAEIVDGVALVVAAIRRELPQTRILLLKLLPRAEPGTPIRRQLNEVNAGLDRLHDGRAVEVHDLGGPFVDTTGRIPALLMPDLLHPHNDGYEVFAQSLGRPLDLLRQRAPLPAAGASNRLNLGLIGLDTSHVIRFARALNPTGAPENIPGARIVFAYKGGSPDLDVSWSRVETFTRELQEKHGVTVLDSIAEVAARSDAILIESVDGRVHLAQAREVFKAGKPVFIDKPFGGSLADVMAIAELAREAKVPVFGSSGLRFSAGVRELQAAPLGRLRGVIAYGPMRYQPPLPDMFWYGVHAAEALFTLMGTGCQSVVRTQTADTDVVTGVWNNGATGVVYGLRNGAASHRLIAFGEKTIAERPSSGEDTLLEEIVAFFRTGKPPVTLEETIELYAFMEAADESSRRGGVPVPLADVRRSAAR